MRTKVLFAVMILPVLQLSAQPSDSEIKQRILGQGALEVRFTSEKGTVHTSLTEKWYERTAESKWKTEEPGIFMWQRSDYRYDYKGGSWVYNRSYLASNWYDGIPNPTDEEVVQLINENLNAFLSNEYYSGVGALPVVKICSDPKWEWPSMNQVNLNVEYEITTKTAYTQITREKVVRRLRLYRDTGGGSHDPNVRKYIRSGWLPLNTGSATRESELCKVLETKNLSEKEMQAFKTFQEQDEQRKSEKQLASLGSLTIPDFKTDKEFILYIHKMMYHATDAELELFLRKKLSDYYFESGSNVVLNETGNDFLANTLKAKKIYRDMFCEYPQVKHEQYGMMEFYDRALQTKVRIALTRESDDRLTIGDIDCINNEDSDYRKDCIRAGNTNCSK